MAVWGADWCSPPSGTSPTIRRSGRARRTTTSGRQTEAPPHEPQISGGRMSAPSPRGDDLEKLQQDTVGYFLRAANPRNGLIADSSREGAPCSIAATGLGLATYLVA